MCSNPIIIKTKEGEIKVPCGKCLVCKKKRKQIWVEKIIQENNYHKEKCFVTCTFDNKILRDPNSKARKYGASPDFVFNIEYSKKYVQKFIKRVRKKYTDKKISFYHVAEYGENTQRPHHHFIFWGTDFNKNKWHQTYQSKSGKIQFISEELNELWACGNCTIQDINSYNSLYIASYTTTKQKNQNILKPKMSFSNRSRIGYKFIRRYKETILKDYFETEEGIKLPIPNSYKKIFNESKILEKKETLNILENLQNKEYPEIDSIERKKRMKKKEERLAKSLINNTRDFE